VKAILAHNESQNSVQIEPILVHTGQHYDYAMSAVFFKDLAIPSPDVHLGVGSGTHAEQTGRMLIELEKLFMKQSAELVVVVGDVNSTLAGALAATKLNLPVVHVEAGVRSYDMSMPEEVNRVLTDHISKVLFTTCQQDDDNLLKEGIGQERIVRSGNIMADTLISSLASIQRRRVLKRFGLSEGGYCLVTLHRPSNVDDPVRLAELTGQICKIARRLPVVFPVHPRTQRTLTTTCLDHRLRLAGVQVTEPLGYLDFASLELHSRLVVTDSGGVQVETTVLGVPCLTIMDLPVWTITHELGTNHLLGKNMLHLAAKALQIASKGKPSIHPPIPLWDGHAAERIVEVIGRLNPERKPG
jgi:UDP-N-acetylglucosamine 2-epimerase (non-hydrolysing)